MNIYYANIEDDDTLGMLAISIVDRPAIERNFQCFANEAPKVSLQLSDESKHCIFGPALIADMPIYRRSSTGEPFYVVFTADVIEQMVERFAANNFNNIVDLQHDGNFVDGVVMTQIFTKNSNKGINPVGYEDLAEGSLFVQYKIQDDNLWNEIITSGNLNGFSIECVANLKSTPKDEDLTQDYL